MEIASTGNYKLMIKSGFADKNECYEAFEAIVKKNGELNGDFSFNREAELLESLALLNADYNGVKSALLALQFEVDDAMIAYLAERGFRINTSGAKAYKDSIKRAIQISNNLKSKIESKIKEMDDTQKPNDRPMSFEEVIAATSVAIGLPIDREITLAGFNEYQRILRKRNQPKKQQNIYEQRD